MNDDNLDLLDLDDGASMDTLPDATPFAAPRPKKPWLLLTVGLVVIVLATYVIIRTVGGTSSSAIEVDLDAPAIVVDGAPAPDMNVMPPAPKPVAQPQPVAQPVAQPQPKPQPVAQPQPAQPVGTPVRVVEDRKEVTFNPAAKATPKPAAKPAAKPQPKPAAKPAVTKSVFDWYVQLGSYSTRALAENAQRQMRAAHASLFQGQQFVILAAQLKNGTTTYRLRVGFKTAAEANGFCRNAKSDGLDCYVAK
ncbi:MAG: SPOR domain-containing protein [Alphaproteobacteria bacterium]|nr:SPOR domain-containing protein [Alphaproteobacteria bacterium]